MPSYKLIYFNGRGEVARMLFAVSGTKFEDVRVEFSDWPNMKPDTPQGILPVLEVDGKYRYTQSMAVFRYLAREFDMYGKTSEEKGIVDMMMDTILDMFTQHLAVSSIKDETEKASRREVIRGEVIPRYLGYLENMVNQTGTGGYAVEADLLLNVYVDHVSFENKLDPFPLLKTNRKFILDYPKVKAYLDARPKANFF